MSAAKAPRRRVRVAAAALAVVAAAAVVALAMLGGRGDASAVALRPDDREVLSLGQRVYLDRCAACHGARLEGQPDWREPGPDGLLPAPPHDAGGHTWHHPDELLFRITKYGVARAAGLPDHRSAMPAYEGVLSDAEIVAALSWIKSQWPREVRARHDEINRQARAAGR